jgi:MFS transporter, DHA1 family, multidrug resistance protein
MAQRSAELKAAETAARPGAPAGGVGLAVLLTLLVAMGPVSTDLYLPSLPGIAADLEAKASPS